MRQYAEYLKNKRPKKTWGMAAWSAGILASIIGGSILYAVQHVKHPVMEVAVNPGSSRYWDSFPFRREPAPVTLFHGWSKDPIIAVHVRIRNAGESPLLDCQPFVYARPIVKGIPSDTSLGFHQIPVILKTGEQKEWDDLPIRFFDGAGDYQVRLSCTCYYYDLLNIRRETKYEEGGVTKYIPATFSSILGDINGIVRDQSQAKDLKAKVQNAEKANLNDQLVMLSDLQRQFASMGGVYQMVLGHDVTVLMGELELKASKISNFISRAVKSRRKNERYLSRIV